MKLFFFKQNIRFLRFSTLYLLHPLQQGLKQNQNLYDFKQGFLVSKNKAHPLQQGRALRASFTACPFLLPYPCPINKYILHIIVYKLLISCLLKLLNFLLNLPKIGRHANRIKRKRVYHKQLRTIRTGTGERTPKEFSNQKNQQIF